MSQSNFYKWYGYTGVLPGVNGCCPSGSGGSNIPDPLLVNNVQVATCLSGVNAPLKVCGDLEVTGFIDAQTLIKNTTDPAVLIDQALDVNGDIHILSSQLKFTNGLRLTGNNIDAGAAHVTAICAGGNSTAPGQDAIAIGNNSQALLNGSIGIGEGVISSATSSTAVGRDSSASHTNSSAFGQNATTTANNQIRLGTATEEVSIPGSLDVDGDMVLSGKLEMSALGSAADGDLLIVPTFNLPPTSTPSDGAIMIDTAADRIYFRSGGNWEYVSAATVPTLQQVLAVGNVTGPSDIVVDSPRKIKFVGGAVISSAFSNTTTASASGIAIGQATTGSGSNAIALGNTASAAFADSVALGTQAVAQDTKAIALGYTATANGTNSVSIGNSPNAASSESIAIGSFALASNLGAIALGNNAAAAHANSVALGPFTTTTAANQIMMGTTSTTVTVPGQLAMPITQPTNSDNLLSVTSGAGTPTSVGVANGSLWWDTAAKIFWIYDSVSGWISQASVVTTRWTTTQLKAEAGFDCKLFLANPAFADTSIKLGTNSVFDFSVEQVNNNLICLRGTVEYKFLDPYAIPAFPVEAISQLSFSGIPSLPAPLPIDNPIGSTVTALQRIYGVGTIYYYLNDNYFAESAIVTYDPTLPAKWVVKFKNTPTNILSNDYLYLTFTIQYAY